MKNNLALTDKEVEEGYILSCQEYSFNRNNRN